MSELGLLSAAQAAERVRAGEVSAAELWDLYRERAADDELNAYLWVAEDAPAPGPGVAPLAGVPLAVKDLFCTEGDRTIGVGTHERRMIDAAGPAT